MAFSFDKRNTVNPNQDRIEANRARMAQESKCIALIIDGVAIEDAVAQCTGITVEMVQEWIAERRIPRQSAFAQPYRATDQDLH